MDFSIFRKAQLSGELPIQNSCSPISPTEGKACLGILSSWEAGLCALQAIMGS